MTPVLARDLARALLEQVPHDLRLLAESTVSTENKGVEEHARLLALRLVELVLVALAQLDRLLEALLVRVRLRARERDVDRDVLPVWPCAVENRVNPSAILERTRRTDRRGLD